MTKTYEARYVPEAAIELNGRVDHPAWQQAVVESRFVFPWEDRQAPRTEFRALFDQQAFYFAFSVDDDDIVLADSFEGKQSVMGEDRVELFFARDDALNEYSCLEIDPLGRVLDYRASYYRKFDLAWSFPGLEVAANRAAGGYSVEGRIPFQSLASLGFPLPESDEPIKFGIYRAEFRHAEPPTWTEGWISWVDPHTDQPDFHVPQSFGRLAFVR